MKEKTIFSLVMLLALTGCGAETQTPPTTALASVAETTSPESIPGEIPEGRGVNYKQSNGTCRVSVKRWFCDTARNKCALSAGYLGPAAPCGTPAFSAACNTASSGILYLHPGGASIGKCYPVN